MFDISIPDFYDGEGGVLVVVNQYIPPFLKRLT
jgi:hypothetical protein